MIIRHGFMRDNEGRWHNMMFMESVEVRHGFVSKHIDEFFVVAEMKDRNGICWTQTMTDVFQSRIEAKEALDDAFGYIG